MKLPLVFLPKYNTWYNLLWVRKIEVNQLSDGKWGIFLEYAVSKPEDDDYEILSFRFDTEKEALAASLVFHGAGGIKTDYMEMMEAE